LVKVKRTLILCAVAAVTVAGLARPSAAAPSDPCAPGIYGTRLASDPAGDTTYAGNATPVPLTDRQEDIRFVDANVNATTVSFTIGIDDLGDADPPNSVGLLASLDVMTQSGGTFSVNAARSTTAANPGSGDINGVGSEGGVSATFDSLTNTITVAGPASVLPQPSASFLLTNAETRADGGIVVAPLTDTAVGDCTYTFGTVTPTAPFDPNNVTITVIDTGITASSPEFNYDETQTGPNGQLVGWWDFSATTSHPACGATPTIWCSTKAPYDPDTASGSHGTGTTGMAAGNNVSPAKTPSACPGCRLAVAKVDNEDSDTLDGSLADAIHWGVDVVHTDVINISIGARVPIPEPIVHDVYAAVRYARERGVLVTFANGNGWADAGIPGQPGGFMNYGNSVDALSVGAAGLDGYLVTTDPEVTATYTVVTSASPQADTDGNPDGYHQISGTSFSSPFLAGVAAHLISAGRLCGAPDLSPGYVEQLLKDTAADDITIPPSNEGYGEVDLATMDTALGVLCNGATRPTPAPETKLYTDHVSGTERMISGQTVSGWTLGGPTITKLAARDNDRQNLGTSTPDLADVEIYKVTLLPGQTLDVTFGYVGGGANADFDVYAYDVTSKVAYNGSTIVTSAATGARLPERLVYTNKLPRVRVLHVAVVGYTLIGEQRFSRSLPLGAPVYQGIAAIGTNLLTF
jgi:hypothetical protein